MSVCPGVKATLLEGVVTFVGTKTDLCLGSFPPMFQLEPHSLRADGA